MSIQTEEDFDAKAMQIQMEIAQKLSELCAGRGNANLPVEVVNDVFRQAIRYYLAWAYKEGVGVKNNTPKIITQ